MGIIRDNDKEKHIIANYIFGALDEKKIESEEEFQPLPAQQIITTPQQPVSNEIDNKKEEMINSLLEKSDLLSNELLKVQKQLSEQQTLFKDEIRIGKEQAYQQGFQDGLVKAKTELETAYNSNIQQVQSSIEKLNLLSSQVSEMMNNLEKELIQTSIAIAKEVIDSEISFNSGQVAINLTRSLMNKLEDAKEIKIRVNLNDFESLKLGLSDFKEIEIIPDPAVIKGGVIVISDVGSIEGNVMERFRKVKNELLQEK